jgi:SAM-dependent methyltransferase
MTVAQTEYGLGVSEAERARLLAQCEIHRGEAESLVDRVGVGPGWRAVDVGCGPLGVLDILADRVGPTGSVTGIDREGRYLAMAATSLGERGVGGVELARADATATGLPGASFDLVHERLVLNNVAHPQDIVAEMARLARPGGYVALQDMDWISWTCEPAHPAWQRLSAAAAAAWTGDVFLGRRLPALLRRAGLTDIGVAAHTRVWRPGDPYQTLLLRFTEIYRDRILDLGALPERELDRCISELTAHLARPDTFTLYATLFQAWARKPGPGPHARPES